MTEDQNPFVHPAQYRLMELIDEAERELFTDQDKTQPLSDPMERFHVAREWGVDPWVAAMLPVSQELTTLQNLAVGIAPDEGIAKVALMSVVTHSLQALALFEEDVSGDQALDDGQLADFLDRLVTQLDARIDKLRQSPDMDTGPEKDGGDKSEDKHVHWAPRVPFLNESASRPITTMEAEDMSLPGDQFMGLAFNEPYPGLVAGEGNDGTPALNTEQRQVMAEDKPSDEHDDWQNHGDVLVHAHDGRMGGHQHGARNLITWEGDIPGLTIRSRKDPGLIQVEEVPVDQADLAHDFVREGDEPEDSVPVDLDGAERALAREAAALRVSAAGSSAANLGGRHASPEDTDPDMGASARHARED